MVTPAHWGHREESRSHKGVYVNVYMCVFGVGLWETGTAWGGVQPWPPESLFFVNLVWFTATEQNSCLLFLLYEPAPEGDSHSERALSLTRRNKHTHTYTKWTTVKVKDLKVRRNPCVTTETYVKEKVQSASFVHDCVWHLIQSRNHKVFFFVHLLV